MPEVLAAHTGAYRELGTPADAAEEVAVEPAQRGRHQAAQGGATDQGSQLPLSSFEGQRT